MCLQYCELLLVIWWLHTDWEPLRFTMTSPIYAYMITVIIAVEYLINISVDQLLRSFPSA